MSRASSLAAPTIARVLSALPDDARCSITIGSGDLTVAELREALGKPSQFRVLTTGQAAEMLGYSSDTWRTWAEEKRIVGAYRDEGEAGNWRLPMSACEEHLARLQTCVDHHDRKSLRSLPRERRREACARADLRDRIDSPEVTYRGISNVHSVYELQRARPGGALLRERWPQANPAGRASFFRSVRHYFRPRKAE